MACMTTAEKARALRVPVMVVDDERLAMPTCAEAQADGVPCDTVHADCECCARALAGEAAPEPPA
jgi:hypothetical protein